MESLRANELSKFEELYSIYGKTEGTFMKFPDLLLLLIEKRFLSNQITINKIQPLYTEAVNHNMEVKETTIITSKKKKKEVKTQEQILEEQKNRSMMNFTKFMYFMGEISKVMFPWEQTRIPQFLEFLWPSKIDRSKSMHLDEQMKKLLDENLWRSLFEYNNHLEYIYTIYIQENIDNKAILLSWREIMLQNKKLTSISLMKFIIDSGVLPKLVQMDTLTDFLRKILPPHTQQEQHFFMNDTFQQIYKKEIQKITQKGPITGDPMCSFWQFQFVILKIGQEMLGKDQTQEFHKDPTIIIPGIVDFLNLRNNDTFDKNSIYQATTPLQNFEMQMSSAQIQDIPQQTNKVLEKSVNDQMDNLQEKFRLNDNVQEQDWLELYKSLDKELPEVPEEVIKHPINPDQIKNKQYVIIGDQMPKPPKDKNPSKDQKKAGKQEKPKRPVIWEGQPQPEPGTSEKNIFNIRDNQEFGPTGPSDMRVATLSDMEPLPVIIKEVLYPQSIPFKTRTYVEAAIQYHLENNFALSLENFQIARKQWTIEEGSSDITELFILFSEGQVYESANREDLALQKFLGCKLLIEKFPVGVPDRAIPYCGLGNIFFNMEEYEMALRSFLMARQVRESSLGEDTADVATCYNNIGACFYCMDRCREALAYFKLSQAIFESELGVYHSRTQIAKQNMNKCQRQAIKLQPEYKTLWKIYELDIYKKKKATKKKK